jgi:hypothetical protein
MHAIMNCISQILGGPDQVEFTGHTVPFATEANNAKSVHQIAVGRTCIILLCT